MSMNRFFVLADRLAPAPASSGRPKVSRDFSIDASAKVGADTMNSGVLPSQNSAGPPPRRRGARTLALGALAIACLLALVVTSFPSRATASDMADVWQAYLDAAATAVADNDDETAALALNAALELALSEDPKGWRVALAEVQLSYVYQLLGRTEASRRARNDTPDTRDAKIDDKLAAQADTLAKFANAYFTRWQKIEATTDETAARKRTLIGAAAYLYQLRTAIVGRFKKDDHVALAEARYSEGRAKFESGNYIGAIDALKASVELWDELQARHNALKAASRQLAPVEEGKNAMPSDLETDIGGTLPYYAKIYLALSLQHRGWGEERANPEAAITDFEAAISRVERTMSQYSDVIAGQLEEAFAHYDIAAFCRDERALRASLKEANLGALVDRGRQEYELALAILSRRGAPTLNIAKEYAKFLRDSGEEAQAAIVEGRFPQLKDQ